MIIYKLKKILMMKKMKNFAVFTVLVLLVVSSTTTMADDLFAEGSVRYPAEIPNGAGVEVRVNAWTASLYFKEYPCVSQIHLGNQSANGNRGFFTKTAPSQLLYLEGYTVQKYYFHITIIVRTNKGKYTASKRVEHISGSVYDSFTPPCFTVNPRDFYFEPNTLIPHTNLNE